MKTLLNPTTSKRGLVHKISTLTLATLVALSAFTAKADIEWQGGTDNYTNASAWVGGAVPGPGDNAANSNGTNNVVQISAGDPDWTVTDIAAGGNSSGGDPNSSGAIEQNGPTLNVNGWLHIGSGSNSFGIYTLDSGTINVTNGPIFLGEGPGSTSVFNINGGTINKGNPAISNPIFYIANANWNGNYTRTGTVNQAGGTVNSASEMWVGEWGDGVNIGYGVYNLHSGGTINITNYLAIGRSGGNGTLNMDGGVINQNNAVNSGNILVGTGYQAPTGGSSVAVLNQSGGTINCLGQFLVPEMSPATGTYNMSGTAALNAGNNLVIGRFNGTGILNLTNGAITITGNGSGYNLIVGGSYNGTLNQYGGTITNTVAGTWVGNTSTGVGTWNVNGGTDVVANVVMCVSSGASGVLTLNGGLFQATGITSPNNSATSVLDFNGGTLQAGANNSSFISNLQNALMDTGGAVIDSQGYNITIPQALTDYNGGGLVKNGTGTLTLTGTNTYIGNTVINAGAVITGTASTASGNVTAADTAGFGVIVQSAGAQYSSANVTLGSSTGASLSFDMGAFGNPSASQAPLNVSSTFTKNGTITVSIADALPQLGQFPLVKYGTLAGTGNFVLASFPTGVTAVIVTNSGNSSIDLNITGVNQPRWEGLAGGNWDIGLTTNWINIGTGLPTSYTDPSAVVFNDSALGTTNVNLTTTVNPTSITMTNNSLNYTFLGTGKISGSIGLKKTGTGTLSILNTGGNSFTGPVTISGGILNVTNLANGGSPSAIGASSANPTNLVLAGGAFSYSGSPVTINRGYQMTASSTITNSGNLTLTGLAQATAGTYVKLGSGTLTYAGVGTNVLSVTSGSFSAQVLNGTLVLDGSAGGQTNTEGGEMYVGSGGLGTNSGANLIVTNSTLNCNTWFAIARGSGTSGFTSTASLYNSTLTCPGGLSLCYNNGLAGYLANGVLSLSGNSQVIDGGALNIGEANTGGNATVTLTGSSALIANGGNAYIGNTLSKGVLNLNSTGTNSLGNASTLVFRVGGGANAGDTGVGAINQSAGTIISGSNSVYLAVAVGGAACYGSINLSGGTFTRNFGMRFGRGGPASFVQSGGTFNLGSALGGEFSMASVGAGGNQPAVATFTGGSATIYSGFGFRVPESSTTTATVNIGTEAGGNASVVTLFSSGFQLCYGGTVSTGNLNLDSGTLQLGGPISKNGGTGTATVNLNGGTVQAGVSTVTLIDTTPSSVNVYKGGLTVDSMANTATVSGNLLTTAGNGIYPAGGTLTVPSGGGSGYIGAPVVAVSGGSGSGAMAVATISNGVVTNVVMTCPGKNYVAGDNITFAFSGGGYTTVASSFVYTLQAGDVAANAGGGLTKIGSGTLYLNGANTYTGSTLVNGGTLAGIGSVAGAVTVASGGTLAAGSSPSSLGTNTVAGVLTFSAGSTNYMKVNKTGGTKDLLTGMSQVNYGGTLVISNQAGTLANGDSFKLYNATTYNGAFNAIIPATPGTGLLWYTNQLMVNGTLIVTNSVNTNPTNIMFSVSGNLLSLSWPADHTGWRLLVQTNNLAAGVSSNTNDWGTVSGSASVNSTNITINPALPTEFYRLTYP